MLILLKMFKEIFSELAVLFGIIILFSVIGIIVEDNIGCDSGMVSLVFAAAGAAACIAFDCSMDKKSYDKMRREKK